MARGLENFAALVLLSSIGGAAFDYDGCTSIAVSSGAAIDGSAMTSHSNDCGDCDWRMVYVPARDHPEGALRPVHQTRSVFPRTVNPSRSKQYEATDPTAGVESVNVLGYIPEVRHTYGLWESTYAMMNEKGLTMGESTCAAFLYGVQTKTGNGDKEMEHDRKKDGNLLAVANLIAIALERCETARCAIRTMGELGAKYGFYGEDGDGMPSGGEALTIADATGETWVFHIMGGLNETAGAKYEGQRGCLWVAQRVPHGHVAVVANNFIIREVNLEDTENFMAHPGLHELMQEAGLWDGKSKFDFLKLAAPDMRNFSYAPPLSPIPMYTTLRMWHVFSKVAPSQNIEITDAVWKYPFSVPVDTKLSVHDVQDLFRTHYEGTPFDMRLGVLAGPWGSPNRAEGGDGMFSVLGQTARGMSISRTSYTQVGQTGIEQPKLWFAPDAAASSVFVPFYANVLAEGEGQFDEKSFGEGSMKSLDFNAEVKPAWWAFDFVANWMDKNYQHMSENYVYPKVQKLQSEVRDAAAEMEAKARKASSAKEAAVLLGAEQARIQRHVSQEWWNFAGLLVVRYNDYFYNFPESSPDAVGQLGYPAWWLEMIGFDDGSFLPNWVQPSKSLPKLLPVQQKEIALQAQAPKAEALAGRGPALSPATVQEALGLLVQSDALPGHVLVGGALIVALGLVASGVAVGYRLGRQAEGVQETYRRFDS